MPRSEPPPEEPRVRERLPSWPVDCVADDTFLYASLRDISRIGIFVRTRDPLPVGSDVVMRFVPTSSEPFALRGYVQWINVLHVFGENLNPGMGVLLRDVGPAQREQLVSAIRTIVYLRRDPVWYGAN